MKDAGDNPFYLATRDVFKKMLDLDILQAEDGESAGGEETVQVAIGLIGDLEGTVVYRFPKTTTLNIVKTLSGMEAEQIDEFATSMLGEIANIISGNAVTYLSDRALNCDIRTPEIAVSDGKSEEEPSTDLCFDSSVGRMGESFAFLPNR